MVATAPRWLCPEELRTWISFLYAQSLLFEQIEQDLQRDSGLPLAYYQILVVLSEHPNHSMRMGDLAQALFYSRSRLSHAIARLEQNGWILREPSPADRRGSSAVLTEEGMKALAAAAPDHVESVRAHLFDQLSPAELEQLRAVSETLVRHLLTSLDIPPPSVLPEPGYWEAPAS